MGADSATGRRVAIVTGGSRGIGRGVVEELAGAGLAVVVGYGANRAEAKETLAAAEAKGAAESVRTAQATWSRASHRRRTSSMRLTPWPILRTRPSSRARQSRRGTAAS